MSEEVVRGGVGGGGPGDPGSEPSDPTYSIFINTTYFMSVPMAGTTLYITSTGCYCVANDATIGTWTYNGDGTFLGFSTTEGASTPDSNYEIGDSITVTSILYLYTVAQLPVLLTLNGVVLTSSGDILTYEGSAQGTQALTLNGSLLTNNGNVLTYTEAGG